MFIYFPEDVSRQRSFIKYNMQGTKILSYVLAVVVAAHVTYGQLPTNVLCANCTMDNGAAYNSHPTDCDKFVQCHFNHFRQVIGEIQQCAFATYWNMDKMTCLPYDQVTCKNDKCEGLPDLTVFGAQSNCRGYWECMGGQAVPKCCPLGYRYEVATGCIEDMDEVCLDRCFNDKEKKQKCDKKKIAGNPNWFKQFVQGHGYIRMPCAPGTIFSQDECTCAIETKVVIEERKCRPEIYLPFTANTDDMSGNGYYVGNYNVFVKNGVANFYGNSRLIIPRFTNLEHSNTVVIKIKYTSSAADPAVARAIVSNSDCGNRPSIMISEDSSNVYFGVGTSSKDFEFTAIPREQTATGPVTSQELKYVFENGVLSGTNGVNETTIDVPGTLRNVQCGLHIGDADDLDTFVGEIDEISVYLCNPDKP